MSPQERKSSSLFQFALIFAVVYLGAQILLRQFFPAQFSGQPPALGVQLQPASSSFTIGHHPVLNLINSTAKELSLPDRCPRPPVDVFSVQNPGQSSEKLVPLVSTGTTVPCIPLTTVGTGATVQISLAPWKYSLFGREGTYEVRRKLPPGSLTQSGTGAGAQQVSTLTARFAIVEPGAFTKLFRTFISAPFLNFLIFVASLLPDHNLGVAIIVLTLVVKFLLFWPTQKALEGQKKMQMLQPKLELLKTKYGSDAKKIQEETMKLWKEHHINPLSACLPTLLQFPILIGLFYTVRDDATLELSRHLIYPFYRHLAWHFGTNFLGLDLLKPNIFIMPILLVVLQFLQMKLSFAIVKRKKAQSQKIIDVGPEKENEKKSASPMAAQQNVMLYGLPLMIGFFALRFPAAVSLYWGVSTLFGIGQQLIVNREHLRV
ncbi:YidC/Oxa1 family membrane protein insertase [Candidatus Peregrinibacteria bacterium]|nr:YidC/Oxa1 family membrane protein insertase [Candidatus Peregrinibacteria bacterium]MBI3816010.1 YidC/Oxa1 family membrane protein insertase [Candidatus Peregrinibacteria bacterium]